MIVPENWWTFHHKDCGIKYRGCHPTSCPKEVYEKTGLWIGDKVIRSSYKENNYGNVFTVLVIGQKPRMCVEVGVLDGYSTLHIAKGIKFNRESFGTDGKLWCWDLWDLYEYNHGDKDKVQKMLEENEVSNYVKLSQGDVFDIAHLIAANSVDFLHVDVSNDGSTFEKVMQFWNSRMKPFGIIVFEGGSQERDEIEWMIKYRKKPIRDEILNNKYRKDDYKFITFEEFPSITILQKKGCFT